MNYLKRKVKKAFTAIEITVVIVVIALLFVALTSRFDNLSEKSKLAGVKTDFRSFYTAVKAVGLENQLYLLSEAEFEAKLNDNLDIPLQFTNGVSAEKDPWKENYVYTTKVDKDSHAFYVMFASKGDSSRIVISIEDLAQAASNDEFKVTTAFKQVGTEFFDLDIKDSNESEIHEELFTTINEEFGKHDEVKKDEEVKEEKPDFSHLTEVEGCPLKFGMSYINTDAGMGIIPFADGSVLTGSLGWGFYSSYDLLPAGTVSYEGCNIVMAGAGTIATCNSEGTEVYFDGLTFSLESATWDSNYYCSHGFYDIRQTYVLGKTDKYTGDTYCVYCDELVTKGQCSHPTTEIRNAKEAACLTDGYTGDIYCLECNKIAKSGNVIPQTGHINTEIRNAKEATNESIGYTGDIHCLDCGNIQNGTYSVIPGKYKEGTLLIESDTAVLIGKNDTVKEIYDWVDRRINAHSLELFIWWDDAELIKEVIFIDDIEITDEGFAYDDYEYMFYGCTNLVKVQLPQSCTFIQRGMFDGCTSLETINLTENITRIGRGSFAGCNALISLTIPDSVKTIDGMAFYNCKNLKEVTIGESVQLIDESAFKKCDNLNSLTFKSPNNWHVAYTNLGPNDPFVWQSVDLSDQEQNAILFKETYASNYRWMIK